MRDTNRDRLLAAARLLRPLLEELVFVGGYTTGLLITDYGAAGIRATMDVDAIAEITRMGNTSTSGIGFGALDSQKTRARARRSADGKMAM